MTDPAAPEPEPGSTHPGVILMSLIGTHRPLHRHELATVLGWDDTAIDDAFHEANTLLIDTAFTVTATATSFDLGLRNDDHSPTTRAKIDAYRRACAPMDPDQAVRMLAYVRDTILKPFPDHADRNTHRLHDTPYLTAERRNGTPANYAHPDLMFALGLIPDPGPTPAPHPNPPFSFEPPRQQTNVS